MKTTSLRTVFAVIALLACCRAAQAQGLQGDGIWIRNAYYGEAQTFDKCLGHQPGNGQYHHHAHPVCLRAQLSDNLEAVNSGRTGTVYREKVAPWKHSPILGWALDGYPIYGPYGFSDPTKADSTVRRIKSSFRLRNITQRTSLPAWAMAHHPNLSQTLSANQYGPDVSETFPLGRYVEDFDFSASFGDLDQYNGRFTVTPEFPNGTYAYFVTVDDNGLPAFPYIIGMQYYGTANVTLPGQPPQPIPANAQTYFANGTYAQPAGSAPLFNSWFTKNSQQDARVVSGFDPSAGAKTTWPLEVPAGGRTSGSVTAPAKADTQAISYTDTTVYVSSNNLGSYTMGPWFIDAGNGGVFQNFPSVQNLRAQLPRTPAAAATKQNTGLGAVGMWVNGVAVYNVLDGATYSNGTRNDVGGGPVRLSSMHVSSASFEGGPSAPGSLMTAFPLFGAKLATGTAAADSPIWPTTLAGATVTVRDAAGATLAAAISYASPGQLNYRVPDSAAAGLATVTITANGVSVPGAINIQPVYPHLFQFTGEGLAAAYVLRVRNGQQLTEPVFQITNGQVTPAQIDLGPATDDVYLIAFGTGLGKTAPQVAVTIGGVNVMPLYAGAQGTFGGLDQYNLLIPRSLAGKGKVDVVIVANGKAANTVNITIK
ncbi:MAG TPA: YHYH protein [Blastocatellia bacterium]|nr:YHYH protein [Blastocatellia bacterium]HMZ17676.1 YHYH protein [Blastocatellia bacterium]HNG32698.1 YHYH protein [Blastocatellia bacterium]